MNISHVLKAGRYRRWRRRIRVDAGLVLRLDKRARDPGSDAEAEFFRSVDEVGATRGIGVDRCSTRLDTYFRLGYSHTLAVGRLVWNLAVLTTPFL